MQCTLEVERAGFFPIRAKSELKKFKPSQAQTILLGQIYEPSWAQAIKSSSRVEPWAIK